MSTFEVNNHAYALAVSGYTSIPQQIELSALESMRAAADLAIEAENRSEQKQPFTLITNYYKAVRCMYCWDAAYMRLLEHPTIHALAALLMGEYQLWDMALLSALPADKSTNAATTAWHRDFTGLYRGTQMPAYLWFFVCLDDVTPENGATWAVPGSHRIDSKFEPAQSAATAQTLDQFPSRVQLCAQAGDLLVLDPTILHTSGRNESTQPRRLLNVALCHRDLQPLMDHWTIAGPSLQRDASEQVQTMLGGNRGSLNRTWPVLPDGWQTDN
jgi:hypothetical protein